jgi:hypothetical protein
VEEACVENDFRGEKCVLGSLMVQVRLIWETIQSIHQEANAKTTREEIPKQQYPTKSNAQPQERNTRRPCLIMTTRHGTAPTFKASQNSNSATMTALDHSAPQPSMLKSPIRPTSPAYPSAYRPSSSASAGKCTLSPPPTPSSNAGCASE